MKHETNDQYLDRLENRRLKLQGYNFHDLDRETDNERLFLKERQIEVIKAIHRL